MLRRLERRGAKIALMGFALLLGFVLGMGSPAHAQGTEAQRPPAPALGVLDIARRIALDSSLAEATAELRAHGLQIELQQDLPPDGLSRLVLAAPPEDDCLPRATWLVCPAVRVYLMNDPQRGHRTVRIEAYQRVEAQISVLAMFGQVASALGPALQTEMAPEAVRGGSVVVWRQRWREDLGDSIMMEVLVTQETPPSPTVGLADPNGIATGVGFVRADLDAEGAIASVRRRLRNAPTR